MFDSKKIFPLSSKNPYYVLKRYVLDFFVFSFLIGLLINIIGFRELVWSNFYLATILLSVPIGWILSSLLHGASHGSVGGKILNRFVGEISGAMAGYGFSSFVLIHILHHKIPDSEIDPVSPKGVRFSYFLVNPLTNTIERTKQYLRLQFKDTNVNYENILRAQSILFYINIVLRLLFWFLLFGPGLFIFLYIPTLINNITIFAHVNYVCHFRYDNGEIEILNLDHNLYYKIANFITMGGYYHKNHHKKFNVLDPREIPDDIAPFDPNIKMKNPIAADLYSRFLMYFNLNTNWKNLP